jgi:hypothetical protein
VLQGVTQSGAWDGEREREGGWEGGREREIEIQTPKATHNSETPRGRWVARRVREGAGQGGGDEEGGECATNTSDVTGVTACESSRLALPFMLEVCVCERER